MKIRIKKDCLYGVVESYDEKKDKVNEVDKNFHKGEIFDGDLIDNHKKYINFQFANGSMVYGLQKKHFRVIEKD